MNTTRLLAIFFASSILVSTSFVATYSQENLRIARPTQNKISNSAHARENFRIARPRQDVLNPGNMSDTNDAEKLENDNASAPTEADAQVAVSTISKYGPLKFEQPEGTSNTTNNSNVFSASVQENSLQEPPWQSDNSNPRIAASQNRSVARIFEWERRVQSSENPFVENQLSQSPPPNQDIFKTAALARQAAIYEKAHHGILHHLASAVGTVGVPLLVTAGGAAGAYVGVPPAFVGSIGSDVATMVAKPTPVILKIKVAHCPAQFDPAFRKPFRWWDDLLREQADEVYMRPWIIWLQAVNRVYLKRANAFKSVGKSSLHVIVNPDGTIYDVSPFFGEGRTGIPISSSMRARLREIIKSVGSFPPFPEKSQVKCYHLIFDGQQE